MKSANIKNSSAVAYERYAQEFLRKRDQSEIGASVVQQWADSLPDSTEVLEIGCGGGYPVSQVLVDSGLSVWAIDSSPSLLKSFKNRFPNVECHCETLQDSAFFDRQFDAVICIGVVFLLPATEQKDLLQKVSASLKPRGKFLFTSPVETGTWKDLNTGLSCYALGVEQYRAILYDSGFSIVRTYVDSGENHYYSCELTE